MSKCPHCGAEVQFLPSDQLVHCSYCGSDFSVSELSNQIKAAESDNTSHKLEGKSYYCTQCGATLLSFDETAVTFCSYCGSQNIIEEKLIVQTAPDVIIPFSKTIDECIKNYKDSIDRRFFCPKYMKSDFIVNKLRGIYMPYGIYNFNYKGPCINHGEKYSHKSAYYKFFDKYTLTCDVDAKIEGLSYDLISNFYDDYSQNIPFDYHGAVEFNPNYLPGYYVDSKDVNSSVYKEEALNIAYNLSTDYLNKDKTFAKYNFSNPKVDFIIEHKKTGLFPMYFASIRDKDNKHLYYAMINGQTGKVVADYPIDFKKYVLVSILLTIPVFCLISFSQAVFPSFVNYFAVFAAIVGFLIFMIQLYDCNIKEAREQDKGYQYKLENTLINSKKNRKKSLYDNPVFSLYVLPALLTMGLCSFPLIFFMLKSFSNAMGVFLTLFFCVFLVVLVYKLIQRKRNFNSKLTFFNKAYLFKIILAFIIPIVVLIANPVFDAYYYGSAIASFVFTIWSFYDLVKLHNQLAARPIPQLDKRGGDENV